MSDEEKKHTHNHDEEEGNDASIYYVLGGVVLVAAIAGYFLLKPKTPAPAAPQTAQEQQVAQAPQPTPTVGPITKFGCERQYYNPVVGLPRYYVSVEGTDLAQSGNVTCEFSLSVKDKVVQTAKTEAALTPSAERGGSTFRCTTNGLELAKGIATKVDVKLTNDRSQSANCSQQFIFP